MKKSYQIMKIKKKREFLDYYNQHNVIPVVNINDMPLQNIYDQRDFFYYKLRINPFSLQNKDVIEFCPGTGINAHYLINKIKVKQITLVDNNPSSIKSLKKNLNNFKNFKIKDIDLKNFKTNKKYDFVILENALPGFENPKKILTKLLNLCKPGGTIITTLTDELGIFSEKLRFVLAKKILNGSNIYSYNNKLKKLTNFFRSHLSSLNTHTRLVDKWVIDNILHEDWIKKNKYFNLADLYSCLSKRQSYIINSISPSLGLDYQWYKKTSVSKHNLNFFKNFHKNEINLLNFKEKFPSDNFLVNRKIRENIQNILKVINKLDFQKNLDDKNKFKIINYNIKKIISILKKIKKNSITSKALNEFIVFKNANFKLKYFKSFWGHCTNQISIYKILK